MEKPESSKTPEKLSKKETPNNQAPNANATRVDRRAEIKNQRRKEIESEYHDIAKKSGVVEDIRLWPDNTYSYEMAMEARTNVASVLHVISMCQKGKMGELEESMLKEGLRGHKKLSMSDLRLLRELPIYLNPDSASQSWRIKEGFHSTIPAIAIDYTESEGGIMDDILDGLQQYKIWLDV